MLTDLFTDAPVEARPAPIILRPYQKKAIEAVLDAQERGVRRALLVLPTGTGKTSCFSALIGIYCTAREERAMVLAHRHELLDQAADRIRLQNPGLTVGIEGGAERASGLEDCIVGGVQTVGSPNFKRLANWRPQNLIIDEAHHAPADYYQHVMHRYGVYEGDCFTIGVTATPHRLDNKPLHGHEQAIFQEVVFTYTLREAINDQYLCDIRGVRISSGVDLTGVKTVAGDYNQGELAAAVDTEERNLKAIRGWFDEAANRRTIVFCASVQHARRMADLFRMHGIAAMSVDGATPKADRAEIMQSFRDGKIQVLTNVDIATEGFDAPTCDCVLMLRPTKSWALYVQMAGRGLRLAPGKENCLVIDVVDNTTKHSLASLPAMIGLPPKMNLKGRSMKEAVEAFENLGVEEQAALFEGDCSIDDLDVKIERVNLLAGLEVPEEITSAGARLAWLKLNEDQYILDVPGIKERIHMVGDALGCFTLHIITDEQKTQAFKLRSSAASSFVEAETIIRDRWPQQAKMGETSAKWRSEGPSPKQIHLLSRLGVSSDLIAQLTRGQASQMISQKQKAVSR